VPRLVESIYSKQSEKPKTACQRKPTASLALRSTERRDKEPFAIADYRSKRFKSLPDGLKNVRFPDED